MNLLSRLAGIIYPEVMQVEDLVSPMLDTMKPGIKGDKDIFTCKKYQLGSIGTKLAFNKQKTSFATIDGFIENLPELQRALKSNGVIVPLDDPARVILSAYEIWKEKFLDKIDGEFALAIFNCEKGELLLARDRIGKKPLYWYQDNRYFIFGSELKSLLATGLVPQTPASDALAMYLYFGFIPQDLSPIAQVNKLLPGHYLTLQVGTGRLIKPYWSYSAYFSQQNKQNPDEIKRNLATLLTSATKKLIPSGEDMLGCFITGGLGSATVASEVSSQVELGRLKAFSVCFEGENDEDLEIAKKISRTLNLSQKSASLPPNALTEELVQIVWSLDEPLADPTVVSTWKLCQMAAKETETVFSGMGSDEFLVGHNRYTVLEQDSPSMSRLKLISSPLVKKILVPLASFFYPPAAYKMLKIARTNPWQFEFLRHNAIFDETRLQEASPRLAPYFDPDVFLHKFHHLSHIKSRVSSFVYLDIKSRLPDHFMLQYERLTKAKGLSWRCPFLNRDLIEYTAALAEPELLAEDQTAINLKPLIEPIFSDEIINRPKQSRRDFLNSWAEKPELDELFQYLLRGTLVQTGYISDIWLKKELSLYRNNKDNFRILWAILVLEVWFHLFINHPIRPRPSTTNLTELLSEP